jgi:hypothetical protein
MFSLICGRYSRNLYTKTSMIIYKLRWKHVCNSGITLWNSGKERKEKRMIEHQ